MLGVAKIDCAEFVDVFPGCDCWEDTGVEPKRPVAGGFGFAFEVWPNEKPPDVGLLASARTLLPPPPLAPPPKTEGPLVAVALPNSPEPPLVAVVLPKRPPPADDDAALFDVAAKRPPDEGCEDAGWPNNDELEVPEEAV